MENQTIREQIFDALFDYTKKWGGIYTESDCATVRDEICLQIDQSQFTADEAEEHINQEVERRIAERMPTKIDAQKKIFEICSHPDNIGKGLRGIISTPMKLEMYDEWYRSRLTNQKTEGGTK